MVFRKHAVYLFVFDLDYDPSFRGCAYIPSSLALYQIGILASGHNDFIALLHVKSFDRLDPCQQGRNLARLVRVSPC